MKFRRLAFILPPLLLVLLAACVHVPPGAAEEVHVSTSVMGVSKTTDLTGIKVTNKTVRADDARFSLSFPGFNHTTTAKGVVLSNPPAEKKDEDK